MAASLAALRPAFATFYDLLNDEQKARLVAKTYPPTPSPGRTRNLAQTKVRMSQTGTAIPIASNGSCI